MSSVLNVALTATVIAGISWLMILQGIEKKMMFAGRRRCYTYAGRCGIASRWPCAHSCTSTMERSDSEEACLRG